MKTKGKRMKRRTNKESDLIGYYHSYNFFKMRILHILFNEHKRYFTTREMSGRLGVSMQRVSNEVSRWSKLHFGYTRRIVSKNNTNEYKYRITKTGARTFVRLYEKFKAGKELNLRKDKPTDSYIRISKHGSLNGLTVDDVLNNMKRTQKYAMLKYRGYKEGEGELPADFVDEEDTEGNEYYDNIEEIEEIEETQQNQ